MDTATANSFASAPVRAKGDGHGMTFFQIFLKKLVEIFGVVAPSLCEKAWKYLHRVKVKLVMEVKSCTFI